MAINGNKVTTFEAFKDQSFTQAQTLYSPVKSFNGTCAAGIIGAQAVADSTPTGTLTLTIEGSQDGKNFDTGGALISSLASDGAHDHGVLDWKAKSYQFFRIKAVEDNVSTMTGVCVWITVR